MKYGDYYNVTKDVKTLNDILNRQGTTLLLEVIAEHAGNCSIKFKMTNEERNKLIDSLIDELKESLYERL